MQSVVFISADLCSTGEGCGNLEIVDPIVSRERENIILFQCCCCCFAQMGGLGAQHMLLKLLTSNDRFIGQ